MANGSPEIFAILGSCNLCTSGSWSELPAFRGRPRDLSPRAGCGKSACPVRRAGCVRKTRNRRAVRKMKEGPSEPPCRRRLQTAIGCFGPKVAVVNAMVKRRGKRSRHVWIRETSVSYPLAKASKSNSDEHQNRICPLDLGIAWRLPTYWPCGVPVHRRRDSNSGFRMELENRTGDVKGKGTSGGPMRPKVPMHRPGAHCSVVAKKRGNSRGAKGAGHPRQDGVNRKLEELLVLMEGGSLL